MRISGWQQLSSNHSGVFTVVGSFGSAADARRAGNELKSIVDSLRTWWDNLEADDRQVYTSHGETSQLTPIEQELSKKYQVQWPFVLDWFYTYWDQEPIVIIGQHVIVQNPNITSWKGPQPFDEILKKFGASVALDVESQSHQPMHLFIDAIFQLPDQQESAGLLFERFREDFDAYRQDFWKADKHYSPNLDLHFDYQTLTENWGQSSLRLFEIERHGQMIHLFGLSFYGGESISLDIQHFIAFLESEGCSDLKLTFYSHPVIGGKD